MVNDNDVINTVQNLLCKIVTLYLLSQLFVDHFDEDRHNDAGDVEDERTNRNARLSIIDQLSMKLAIPPRITNSACQ